MSRKSTKSIKARALGKPDRKKRVNSKVKGNKNELEVAKALTKWAGVEFRRTPMSGAIHVPRSFLCGDVFCVDRYFEFNFEIETKHYNKISHRMSLKFFDQAQTDADRIQRHPLLLLRENGDPRGYWMVYLNVAKEYMIKNSVPHISVDKHIYRLSSYDFFSIPYKKFSTFLSNIPNI